MAPHTDVYMSCLVIQMQNYIIYKYKRTNKYLGLDGMISLVPDIGLYVICDLVLSRKHSFSVQSDVTKWAACFTSHVADKVLVRFLCNY